MKVDVVSRSVASKMVPQPDVCFISIWSLIKLATEGYDDSPIQLAFARTIRSK